MTEWREALGRFLATDPRDAGCDETAAVLHLYVERPAAERDPGVAAHLAACEACAENARGLLRAVREGRRDEGP